MDLKYLLHSGKNSNLKMYLLGYARHLLPKYYYTTRLKNILRKIQGRADIEYIRNRVDYYNKMNNLRELPKDLPSLSDFNDMHQDAYFIDLYRTSRWFDGNMVCNFRPGDITTVSDIPSIVKSRPINGDNVNSIVLKLDRTRHFIFLKDKIKFFDKNDMAIFRGGASLPNRKLFMEMYYDHPLVDAAESNKHPNSNPPEWRKKRITLYDHLKFKFIISIEGNDVASNLKWVMSSNSIAVMPRPKYETWFMEGKLIPNYHYIEIKSDYSDLPERLRYYMDHEDEALEIINHAHEYVSQFFDEKRENLIEILVLQKYFQQTGQI